tara:strand:+ start:987 stop:1838 length:852 start_codon:yes stop_codon:yes gene_type:complete
MNKKDITFIITTYRSEKIIDECLKDLPLGCKKIVVENSYNHELKKKLEQNYFNLDCYIMADNLGYGKANNFGIKKADTDYVFILNPDTKLTDKKLSEIIEIIQNQDFAIAAPQIIEPNRVYKQNKSNQSFIEVKEVPGMALILNKNKFQNNYFDENIFLYLEEIDLCKRITMKNERIIELGVQLFHLGGKSHGGEDFEIEKSKNWHWMWSKFYFNKKYNGYIYSFLLTLPSFIGSFLKFFSYKLFGNKKKSSQYKMRFLGLLNAYFQKKSHQRPYQKKTKLIF